MKNQTSRPIATVLLQQILLCFGIVLFCTGGVVYAGSADLNGDAIVDGEDLGLLLGAWGECPVGAANVLPCPEDINFDDQVNGSDLGLLLGAWGPVPACSGDIDEFCCSVHETPGCEIPGCCNTVCEIMPFCCEVQWSMDCVNIAQTECSSCPGCPGEGGSCCSADGTPGCDDVECCELLCNLDGFCCMLTFDAICADLANDLCDVCQVPGACCLFDGTCVQTDGLAGCNELGGVFQGNDTNCDSADCPDNCPAEGDCCVFNGTTGCNDNECCTAVCEVSPFCCTFQWNATCAEQAQEMCDLCDEVGACCFFDGSCIQASVGDCQNMGGLFEGVGTPCESASCPEVCPGMTDCCIPHFSLGCSDAACCLMVCENDPFCCESNWDDFCVEAAFDLCGGLCEPGSCCKGHIGPGCNDQACEDSVCEVDPFCCRQEWDVQCARIAANDPNCDCEDIPPSGCPGLGDCCVANGTVGCEDVDCCEAVCINDMFCCDVEWDSICAGAANREPICDCKSSPGECGNGDCCNENGSPGCNNEACCEAVCEMDVFCCDVQWDAICAQQAGDICDICQ